MEEVIGADIFHMEEALREAAKAESRGEVPVGAVLVSREGEVVSKAHNMTITLSDPTAHAEILALRIGAEKVGNYRLLNTTLYSTVEPCVMCMGAVIHARVKRIVFGAFDKKWGAAGSLYNFALESGLNHAPEITSGICADRCKGMIQDFFRKKR